MEKQTAVEQFLLAAAEFVSPTIVKNDLINLNIYITSDKETKEGDWCVDTYKLKNNHNPIFKWSDKFKVDAKKIILTTDQDLIKDGVQAINDEFLECLVEKLIIDKLIDVKNGHIFLHLQSKAIDMEKEQIKEAYISALPYGLEYSHYDKYANKYYNETYNKET
jgi:hypothetical protein